MLWLPIAQKLLSALGQKLETICLHSKNSTFGSVLVSVVRHMFSFEGKYTEFLRCFALFQDLVVS